MSMRYGIPDKLPARTPARIPPTYPLPVPKGCVLLYDMLGGGHTKVLDHSGNHYDGTLTGTTQTATGRYFNGSSFIDTGVESLKGVNLFADTSHKFTVIMAAQVATAASGTAFARAGATSTSATLLLYFVSPALYVRLRGTLTTVSANNDGKAHISAVIWDGVAGLWRYDRASGTAGVGTSDEEAGQRIIVGGCTNGTRALLAGDIYWLEVYNRALSAAEYEERRQYIKAVLQARGVTLP